MLPLPRIFGSSESVEAMTPARQEIFADRYQEFFPRVFAFVYGRVHNVHLTEDLVADVFEKVFRKSDSLRNEEAFATWLFTIARNVVTSHGRRLRNRETVMDPEVLYAVAPPAPGGVEREVLLREEVEEVVRCMQELPQREQDIIALKFDAGLDNRQIAEIMGLSEPNVRVILFRSLRKLREMMTVLPRE